MCDDWYYQDREEYRPLYRCVQCGTWFRWDDARRAHIQTAGVNISRRFCSHECALKYRQERKAMNLPKGCIRARCIGCRKWFAPKNREILYHSKHCQYEFGKLRDRMGKRKALK